MDLTFTTHAQGAWTVVHVAGQLDPSTAGLLQDRLLELAGAGQLHLVVDLSAVQVMDPTGPAVLIAARDQLRAHDGALRIVCTHDPVRKVLRRTGLAVAFGVPATSPDADAPAVVAPAARGLRDRVVRFIETMSGPPPPPRTPPPSPLP